MKLIELIIKHVPRDKIPARAKFFAQHPDEYHETWGFSEEPCLHNEEGEWRSEEGFDNELYSVPVAEDARTTVITRGELMYAYDAAELTKVHFDTVAKREQLLCIFPVDKSDHTEIWLPPGSQVTVEDNWLTVRCHGNLVGMFRMENVEAWLINAVTK